MDSDSFTASEVSEQASQQGAVPSPATNGGRVDDELGERGPSIASEHEYPDRVEHEGEWISRFASWDVQHGVYHVGMYRSVER